MKISQRPGRMKQTIVDDVGPLYIDDSNAEPYQTYSFITGQVSKPIPLSSGELGEGDILKPTDTYTWTTPTTKNRYEDTESNPTQRSLQVAALVTAWFFFATMVLLVLYRKRRRRTVRQEQRVVRKYLQRFKDEDVKVLKSPPGGWNVVYRRALANRVGHYWSKELPSIEDSATIVFESSPNEKEGPSSEEVRRTSIEDGECRHPSLFWSNTTEHTRPFVEDSSEGSYSSSSSFCHDRVIGFPYLLSSLSMPMLSSDRSSETQRISCRPRQRKRPIQRERSIITFLRTQFSLDDVQLEESSMPGGAGWSVVYRNRLAEGENERDYNEHSEMDTIDFVSPGEDVLLSDNDNDNDDDHDDVTTTTRVQTQKIPLFLHPFEEDEEVGLIDLCILMRSPEEKGSRVSSRSPSKDEHCSELRHTSKYFVI